jgi:TonB family protein
LKEVMVANSSGHDELDQYARDKITKLRLPRVPAEFRDRAFTVQIPVTFAVRKK